MLAPLPHFPLQAMLTTISGKCPPPPPILFCSCNQPVIWFLWEKANERQPFLTFCPSRGKVSQLPQNVWNMLPPRLVSWFRSMAKQNEVRQRWLELGQSPTTTFWEIGSYCSVSFASVLILFFYLPDLMKTAMVSRHPGSILPLSLSLLISLLSILFLLLLTVIIIIITIIIIIIITIIIISILIIVIIININSSVWLSCHLISSFCPWSILPTLWLMLLSRKFKPSV